MGASWSITFVSKDGEEVSIPADIVSACSPVWQERLKLAGTFEHSPRSEENCTSHELQCFKTVLSIATQPIIEKNCEVSSSNSKRIKITMESRDEDIQRLFDTLISAMPLLHKYDCENALDNANLLVACAFPCANTSRPTAHGASQNHIYGTVPSATPLAKWLTQSHLDYIISLQELFGPTKLSLEMKELLFFCLSRGQGVKWPKKAYPHATIMGLYYSVAAKEMKLNFSKTRWAAFVPDEGTMVLQAFKITSETFCDLFQQDNVMNCTLMIV
jgi:hypothetical protein